MQQAQITTLGTADVNFNLFNRFAAYIDASPATVETYKRTVKQFIKYLAEQDITQPTRQTILDYKEHLKRKGLKPSTIQNYITAVKIFFGWTSTAGLYPNIADHIKGVKLDRAHKKDYLTADQTKAVLTEIDTSTTQGVRDYAIFTLMVTCGLRDIEISRANVGDIRTLGNNTVLYLQGKGREERTEYVKLPAETEKAIRAYLNTRSASAESAPLFTSLSNNSRGNRLTPRSVSRIIKNRLQTAGYNSNRLTAHSLRHTAVTLSLLAGRDITEVQQFARHRSINTTMIYNHAIDRANNACSAAVAAAIFYH